MAEPKSRPRAELDERQVELPADVGSPEQGLESDQPPHVDSNSSDVKRNINPARTQLRHDGSEPADEP